MARLFFDNVAHLQASWLTTGKDVGQLALHMGVDDLGSIMLEENVISSAGAKHRSNLHELIQLIRTAGRIPAQRDTLYRHLRVHWTPADDPTDERVRLALLLDRHRRAAAPASTLPLVDGAADAPSTSRRVRCRSVTVPSADRPIWSIGASGPSETERRALDLAPLGAGWPGAGRWPIGYLASAGTCPSPHGGVHP